MKLTDLELRIIEIEEVKELFKQLKNETELYAFLSLQYQH